jgi:hypothetical protein
MAFPVRVGCAVDEVNNKGLAEVYGVISEARLTAYRMYGSIYKSIPVPRHNDNFCYQTEVGNVTGVALSDGTIMIYIEPPDGSFDISSQIDFNVYMVTLRGPVPFKASDRCLGDNFARNEDWAMTLQSQIVTATHLSQPDWYGTSDGTTLAAQGQLNSLKLVY